MMNSKVTFDELILKIMECEYDVIVNLKKSCKNADKKNRLMF